MTTPIFIVSSGRSGTAMMERLLGGSPQIEMHHEYMVHHIQPASCRYAMGLCNLSDVRAVLNATHRAAMDYCDRPLWGDASNKLSWIIPALARTFPDARFVHLARDGRKVASSYFNKLNAECYDDVSVERLYAYTCAPGNAPGPPPEKRYWWPQPLGRHPDAERFRSFTQFERIAWHWAEINRTIQRDLALVPHSQQLFMRLEDLTADPAELRRFLEFIGLEFDPAMQAPLKRPHNVNRPEDKLLDDEQTSAFWAIAGDMMSTLGYANRAEYAMRYQNAG
jgi:hypothetical protein